MTIPRRNKRERADTPTTPPAAPDRGVTLNLRNPDVLRGEWDAEARKSEATAKQDTVTVTRLRKEAVDLERLAGQAADDEMRLMEALSEARQRREKHSTLKDARLNEAQQVEDRAKFHEDRAADLRVSIDTLLHAADNSNGQVTSTSVDLTPAEAARIEGALSRIDAACAELPADQRDEDEL